MKFQIVAGIFNQIELISSRLKITELLAGLFKQATPSEASIICNLSLGLLHPPYIGTQFNIAEKSAIKSIAHITGESLEAIEHKLKKIGDLGNVLEELKTEKMSELTISQVFKSLDNIEKVSGTGSQEEKAELLAALIKELDASSAKYVIRILLGKLRLGFSDMTILDALSWMEVGNKSLTNDLENAYNICADLGLIARTLKDGGIDAVRKMHVQIGIPILPAAAERLPTAEAIIKKIGHCVVQPKLDGFRLQVHVDNRTKHPKIHFFSRNLTDMSEIFPELVAAFKELNVETLICEGEAISYDPQTDTFLPFQETVKRKRKHGVAKAAEEFPLKFFIFDIMYLDGKELLDNGHEERREQMAKALKGVKSDVIAEIEEKKIETGDALEKYFLEMVSEGLEGIVAKKPDAIYQAGKRNFNWIKLKRVEAGHIEDTIDCVILGYYAGEGKRASFGIGAFLVGLYNKKEDVFQTVAKIGTGLKDHDWKELKKRCDAISVKNKPHSVECPKELAPDVWVSPQLVCEIRADEITLSPLHTAAKTEKSLGYALRFPRFMKYRDDKSEYEATEVSEIARMYKDQFKK